MSKILLLMRHAKSSWKDEDLADHDRPLNKRGQRAAPRMGQLLCAQQLLPDLVVSSSARRAQATATLVSQAAGYQGDVLVDRDLYHAGVGEILGVMRQFDDRYRSVLVIGHNPGMVELLAHLTDADQELPTAALAHLRLGIHHWNDLDSSTTATLMNLWRPRDLA